MATTGAVAGADRGRSSGRSAARSYLLWATALGACGVGTSLALGAEAVLDEAVQIAAWAAAAILADALVVQVSRSATLSMSLPVTLAAALVLSPPSAALAALLGTWSRGESRKRDILVICFNRVQVSVATLGAALVATALGADASLWPEILGVVLASLAADTLLNGAFMLPYICLVDGLGPLGGARLLLGHRPAYNALVYMSAGLTAPVIALSYESAGSVGLIASLAGIVLGGEALLESQRVAHLSEEILEKEAAIRSATDQMVTERKDERASLAGELHDEVLPALFKVHLMGQVVRHDLSSGRLLELEEDVASLLDATEVAQSSIRGVVGGLRSSPLGPHGLEGAVRRVSEQMRALSAPRIEVDVGEVKASERAQLIAFQVIREALVNSAKYSGASLITVTVRQELGRLRLSVADDGRGFDPDQEREGHFGLLLMRERVEAAGGVFDIQSRLGIGVEVSAAIPTEL